MDQNFKEQAIKKFGDKITIKKLSLTDEQIQKINNLGKINLTQKDLEDQDECAWLMENKCPNCNADLGGLFGSFTWGIVHGYGFCAECNETEFKYYHYIGSDENRFLFQAFALEGFNP